MNAPEESRPLPARLAAMVMVCNPLLLLSPMCLLYGIYRAVVTPNLFATDNGNTIFNFVTLAVYVLMVCVTSTLLARKRIVPDTVMLLLLNGLLFVAPFILIAHGVFLEDGLAVSLGALGTAMGLGQLEILKRRLPGSFMSPQLMIGGALVLLANFAAPMIFRRGLENNNEAWGSTADYAWYLILPLLVAWINFLPARPQSESMWSRSWFAPLIYLLWVAGTSVELWTVAYVDDRRLEGFQFTVALWVLAWTAFRRANAFEPAWAARVQKLAPICAIILPGLGALDGLDLRIAALLYILNLPLLALAFGRLPVFALGGLSVVGALCCLPIEWILWLSPEMGRGHFATLAIGGATLGAMAILRDSRAGFLAAVGLGVGVAIGGFSATLALNAAILFLFLHQLRWPSLKRDEHLVLSIAGAIWIFQTCVLEMTNAANAHVPSFIATVVATICLRNASLGLPTSLVPAVCSIIILCLHPMHWSAKAIATTPSGLLAILVGFLLLAAGGWDSARRSHHAERIKS